LLIIFAFWELIKPPNIITSSFFTLITEEIRRDVTSGGSSLGVVCLRASSVCRNSLIEGLILRVT
jgi:hypothetical protein